MIKEKHKKKLLNLLLLIFIKNYKNININNSIYLYNLNY